MDRSNDRSIVDVAIVVRLLAVICAEAKIKNGSASLKDKGMQIFVKHLIGKTITLEGIKARMSSKQVLLTTVVRARQAERPGPPARPFGRTSGRTSGRAFGRTHGLASAW